MPKTSQRTPIGAWIATCRRDLGWRQEDLARHIPTTQATVSRWEKGEATPSLEMINALHQIFISNGLLLSTPPVIQNPHIGRCLVVGTVEARGHVKLHDAKSDTEGGAGPVPSVEEVDIPAGLEGVGVVAYRIGTEDMMPFAPGWLLFAAPRVRGIEASALDGKLVVADLPGHGPVLGTLRVVGGGFAMERSNAPLVHVSEIGWAEKVVDIRPV